MIILHVKEEYERLMVWPLNMTSGFHEMRDWIELGYLRYDCKILIARTNNGGLRHSGFINTFRFHGDVLQWKLFIALLVLCAGNSPVTRASHAGVDVSLPDYIDRLRQERRNSSTLAMELHDDRWPVNSPHKGPVTRKMFPFDDVIMSLW